MGLSILSVFKDVQFQVHKDNGTITVADFNRMSKRAENRLLEFLTGGFILQDPSMAYITQKTKDILFPLITKYKTMVSDDGSFDKPQDYYSYENMYTLELVNSGECSEGCSDCNCDESENGKIKKMPIELLDGQQFYYRVNTDIRGLKPSKDKPIAKQLGNGFEINPKDVTAVTLEYIRYPKYGEAVSYIDPIYNEEVIDPNNSVNYEWDEKAREILIYFITDFYSNHLREVAMKQFNESTGKTVIK